MKSCTNCKQNKPKSDFSFRDKAKGKLQSWCQECNRAYNKKHYIDNKKEYLKEAYKNKKARVARNYAYVKKIKSSTPCADCGKKYHYVAMDFDHISEDKEFCITRGCSAGLSISKIASEIKKCEIVCSNCNRIRTWKRKH